MAAAQQQQAAFGTWPWAAGACAGGACNPNSLYWAAWRPGAGAGAWSDWCRGNSNCDGINDFCIGNSNCWQSWQAWCGAGGAGVGACAPGVAWPAYRGRADVLQGQMNAQVQAIQQQLVATADVAQRAALVGQMNDAASGWQRAAAGWRF